MNSNEELNFLDILSIINFALNITGVSNDTLMRELRKQDQEYLESIAKKVEAINKKVDMLLEKR